MLSNHSKAEIAEFYTLSSSDNLSRSSGFTRSTTNNFSYKAKPLLPSPQSATNASAGSLYASESSKPTNAGEKASIFLLYSRSTAIGWIKLRDIFWKTCSSPSNFTRSLISMGARVQMNCYRLRRSFTVVVFRRSESLGHSCSGALHGVHWMRREWKPLKPCLLPPMSWQSIYDIAFQ